VSSTEPKEWNMKWWVGKHRRKRPYCQDGAQFLLLLLNTILTTWTGRKSSPWASLGCHSFKPQMIAESPSLGISDYRSFSGPTTPPPSLPLPSHSSSFFYFLPLPSHSSSSYFYCTFPARPFSGNFPPMLPNPPLHFSFSRPCSEHFPPTLSIGSHSNPPYPKPPHTLIHWLHPCPHSCHHTLQPRTKTKEAQASKTSVSSHHTTQYNNLENQKFYVIKLFPQKFPLGRCHLVVK